MGQESGQQAFRALIAASRRVCLDTNACIYFLGDGEPDLAALVEIALEGGENGRSPCIPGIVYLELLVHPYRLGGSQRGIIEEFVIEASGEAPQPISVEELELAAQIRAITGMKPPDALVVAAAAVHGCDLLIGNDKDFNRLERAGELEVARRGMPPLRLPRFVRLDEYTERDREAPAKGRSR